MRRFPKFKQYKKDNHFIYCCPKKILKFKPTVYRRYRFGIEKRLKRLDFLKLDAIFISSKRWENRNFFFTQKLLMRRNLNQWFDGAVKLNSMKKAFSFSKHFKFDNLTFLKNTILKLEFNLDILLFRLNMFPSIYAAQKSIDRGLVLVNSNKIFHNYCIKKGDIITIVLPNHNIETILENQIKTENFLPFIEFDLYSNTFIVTKDLRELSFDDITLIMTKHFNLPELYQAIFK
jgi:ribosomal protein S4